MLLADTHGAPRGELAPLPVAVAQRDLRQQSFKAAPDGLNVVVLLGLRLLREEGGEAGGRHLIKVADSSAAAAAAA
jgi:hypothetical protein